MVQVHIMIFMILTILFVLGVVDLGTVIIFTTPFIIHTIDLVTVAITKVLCKDTDKDRCQTIFTLALLEGCFLQTMEPHLSQGLLHKGAKQWGRIKWQLLPEVV
jgi:hypothetical protein